MIFLALLLVAAEPAPPSSSTPPAKAAAPAKKTDKPDKAPQNAAPAEKPAEKSPGPPPPAAELGQLKVLEGKWSCSGKTLETPFGSAHPISATMENKADLNGYWHLWRYTEKKTKENPSPYVMASFVGFDAEKKQLVRTDVDGLGMVTALTTKGWDGDKLVFEGAIGPAKVPFRETLTKKGAKEIAGVQEMVGNDGKWITLAENVCKKKK